MRIAVFGAGGVGGYFGGRLAQVGEDVTFIARGEHLQAIREEGLRVESMKGDFRVFPAHATGDPEEVGKVDAVLVSVKAWSVPEAALAIQSMVADRTVVIPLGNGVDAPAELAAVLGGQHVLGGFCRIASTIAAPGLIRHLGIEPYVAFGELDNRRSDRVEHLRQVFERAGVKAEVPDDIWAAMWEKFLFIAVFSGVGAVTGAPIGILRDQPETRLMLQEALQEQYLVARAHKINLPDDIVQKTLAFMDTLPPKTTASMQRDILEGRPSELNSQNGAVMRLGLQVGVLTPLHTFIYHSLLPRELRARGEVEF